MYNDFNKRVSLAVDTKYVRYIFSQYLKIRDESSISWKINVQNYIHTDHNLYDQGINTFNLYKTRWNLYCEGNNS